MFCLTGFPSLKSTDTCWQIPLEKGDRLKMDFQSLKHGIEIDTFGTINVRVQISYR